MSFTLGRPAAAVAIAARGVSMLGDQVVAVTLVLQWQQRGHGAGVVAALLMANLAPIVVLSGPAGRLLDRYANRPLMVTVTAVQVPICVALAFVGPLPAVLVLVALLGAGQALTGAAWQALLPSLVPPAAVARALSLAQAATVAAMIVAPALAGLLFGAYGLRPAVLIDAATFVLVLLAAAAVPNRPLVAGRRRRGGLAVIAADPLMSAAMTLVALSCLLGSVTNVVQVFLVRVTLHAGPTAFGVAGAAQGVGLLVGALVAGRLATLPRLARALVFGAVGIELGLVAAGCAPSFGWLLVTLLGTGLANGVLNLCTSALVLGRAADAERGRVAGVFTGTLAGTQLVAYAVGGVLAAACSPRTIFVGAGLLGLLGPLALARRVLRAGRAGGGPVARASGERLAVLAGRTEHDAVEVEERDAAEPGVGFEDPLCEPLGHRRAPLGGLDADRELHRVVAEGHGKLVGGPDVGIRAHQATQ